MNNNEHTMTPLEAVTHLFTCLKLADGKIVFAERESWADAISDLFPNHSPDRAMEFLQDATRALLAMDSLDRKNYAIHLCSYVKKYFSEDELQRKVGPKIADIVEADNMVFSSEKDMIRDIEQELGIHIKLAD